MSGQSKRPIVFYDSNCMLCNRFVDFILDHDRNGIFYLAPLQGSTSHKELGSSNLYRFSLGFPVGVEERAAQPTVAVGEQRSDEDNTPENANRIGIDDSSSVVFLDERGAHTRSTAVLRILFRLGGLYRSFVLFFLIPRPLRDLVYQYVANRRYGWFGQNDRCRIPSAHERSRILD